MRSFFSVLIAIALAALPCGSFAQKAQEGPPPIDAPSTGAGDSAGGTKEPAKPIIKFRERVVFAISSGKDEATNAKMSTALVSRFETHLQYPIVPEGDWGLQDYINQCAADPDHTAGAFIVLPPGAGSKRDDYLVLIRNSVTVEFNAMVSECRKSEAPARDWADVVWVSHTVNGEYGRSVVQFLPFAVLTSVYLAFAPQRTYTSQTNRSFPVPSPLPASGANTTNMTTYQTTLNASGTSSLQNSIVTSVAASTLAFGREADPNHLTLHAAEAASWQLFSFYSNRCRFTKDHQRFRSTEGFCNWLQLD